MSGTTAPRPRTRKARVAVVTGASGDIGRHVVHGLLQDSFQVVATDRTAAVLRALKLGPRLTAEVMDVTDAATVTRVAERVAASCGRVDVLVNCAGVYERTPALEMPEQPMRRLLDVNLMGTLRCMAAFGRIMADQARPGGRIVNIASVAGMTGAAMAAAYAASKAGVIAASYSAARELAPAGITVNVIAPGFCDTSMLAPHRALVDAFVVPRIPLKRLARPDEIAEAVVFLATCRTDYLTGTVLVMDGGLHVG